MKSLLPLFVFALFMFPPAKAQEAVEEPLPEAEKEVPAQDTAEVADSTAIPISVVGYCFSECKKKGGIPPGNQSFSIYYGERDCAAMQETNSNCLSSDSGCAPLLHCSTQEVKPGMEEPAWMQVALPEGLSMTFDGQQFVLYSDEEEPQSWTLENPLSSGQFISLTVTVTEAFDEEFREVGLVLMNPPEEGTNKPEILASHFFNL